uniref:PDEase domain-containing protein n=1 Tax=Glossina brevipalpis TaxID=37001 RepID=A0A1A9WT28_9MUSC
MPDSYAKQCDNNSVRLSKRPMGPPHRKSSLPKHQEVKKRFLEICDTTLSEEVRNALRLPAFDSYEWSDADIIHLMQTMFTELGFIEKFNIPIDTLREWLYEVYKHYNEVPFHNFRHCFCVAQMLVTVCQNIPLESLAFEKYIIIYNHADASDGDGDGDGDGDDDGDDDDDDDGNGDNNGDGDGCMYHMSTYYTIMHTLCVHTYVSLQATVYTSAAHVNDQYSE